VLRASSGLPGKLQPTSPLPSQSNSAPTSSLSSAMKPVQGNRSCAHDRRAHIRPLVVEDSASLQMHRMPRVVVVENELLADGGAVESELARWYDLGA
jgi:hypothetical protein